MIGNLLFCDVILAQFLTCWKTIDIYHYPYSHDLYPVRTAKMEKMIKEQAEAKEDETVAEVSE